MTRTARGKTPLLDAIHETAGDLHRLSLISDTEMQQYNALCLTPVSDFDGDKIRLLRDRYQLSQTVLASLLNTSPATVRRWEADNQHPNGSAQKLLDLLERKGLETLL
ncbi:helix-turn-helix domain-containing protein [Thiorhodovibrio frisius]|uniref:Putative transcriptional regulator n=1 Tax=Thiorhodovibrio frisius TaxID=631362 RepID=H8Z8N2_9GAMM|nr:helix-turn-helix domain-containing protein [Thiorhodovibrio frisius]EIC19437.1 putative transcriptional regulator [Thiorhodovibrio frisius]WPL22261.1 Antitoxin igA-2 [Thiorhodovibrio frisius]